MSSNLCPDLYDSALADAIMLATFMEPDLDSLLRTAITMTKLVRLCYGGRQRIIEPHDYGEHKGVTKLLAYQVGGQSSSPLPNWRWMETGKISQAHMMDQTFNGGRPAPSGKHHQWDRLFARVKTADTDLDSRSE